MHIFFFFFFVFLLLTGQNKYYEDDFLLFSDICRQHRQRYRISTFLVAHSSTEIAVSHSCTMLIQLSAAQIGTAVLPLSPLFPCHPFSQCHKGQSLLMRIYLTQYSMRQNPVYTVRLRDSRYPLACSAAGSRGLYTQQGKLWRKGMDKDGRKANATLHFLSALIQYLPEAG